MISNRPPQQMEFDFGYPPLTPVERNAVLDAPPSEPGADPWAHRSAKMKCSTCMWYAPKVTPEGVSVLGRCRRHAPTMNGFPAVFVTDWCGDHKLDEKMV
jgi:hypothetical protein